MERSSVLEALLAELRETDQEEAETIAHMLERIAAAGGHKERSDYLMLCLHELKGWADYAIVKLQQDAD